MWYFIAAGLFIVLSLIFFARRQPQREGGTRPSRTFTEASSELGIPKKGTGALKDRPIKKDALSKEAELVLDAEGITKYQKGAWALEREFDHGDFYKKESYFLPEAYNKDRLVLMSKDPEWAYAYWEVTHDKYKEMYERHLQEWGISRPLLRLYDMSDQAEKPKDIFLNETAKEWYIKIPDPSHSYIAEVGRFFDPDLFVPFVVSNKLDFGIPKTEGYYGFQGSSPSSWGKKDG